MQVCVPTVVVYLFVFVVVDLRLIVVLFAGCPQQALALQTCPLILCMAIEVHVHILDCPL